MSRNPPGTRANNSARKKTAAYVAEFRLGDTEEIKRWILSFGRHAEVIEPEELRGEIGEEVEQMTELYGKMHVAGRSGGRRSRDTGRDMSEEKESP